MNPEGAMRNEVVALFADPGFTKAATAGTMALIRTYFDYIDEPSQLNRMLIALALSQVAEIDNDGNPHEICGFHETDFTKKLKAT